ncbi:MAG: tetratricopeptide repeat protein [Prevotellaceae bacterium]|jgi:tetratricopeptide (TPR) repeat protein|nr:tetratricopeptide repeat protein [Prevotellaceae bacterium]
MKKNTAFRRNYQALNTTFNVHFNANEAFKKGIKSIEDSYKPDYSHIINMYAVSDKSTEGVATGDMARAIEKSEKAIKERSIRQKPKRNSNKMRDPNYLAFYNQEEFNSKMDDVWMMLAKAKFYSNDYLAASATFTYIINHFSGDKLLVAEANIWKAKSFKEMGWTYEANDILKKISDDKFTDRLNSLYAGAWADLLIREGNLKEALPYLETAISLEKNKKLRTRFIFIAGQIYQQLGDKEAAYERYARVISAHPDYQMAFNARIRQTEVYTGGSSSDIIKSMTKMAKSSKNKEYLDQIYYAIGNIYLSQKDTAKAIENYILSTEKSTRNGLEKAQSFIVLGDLYYIQAKYLKAQPAYSEASSIIGVEHPEYKRVSNLSQILDELAVNYQTVTLQDSLQFLATLPKEQQMAAINNVIRQIIQEEAEEQKRLEQEREENRQLDLEIENMALMDQRALGNTQKVSFYFDNKATVEKGKMEFQRRFGKRKLEDNWNRKNRAVMNTSDEIAGMEEALEDMDPVVADSVRESRKQADAENNPKSPEFYLRQIPSTDEQIAASNEQVAGALFNMGIIYNEKLSDYPRSIETFDEFARRFPNDPRVADAYFYNYRILAKQEKEEAAGAYRSKLITGFPDSKYAKILSQPDFREKLERMNIEQDSLYETTYREYLTGNFEAVKANTAYMEATYPISPLIPKFLLLNSLSIGKSGDIETFTTSLNRLIERYPSSDVVSMAKDILALMNQGKSPEAGTPGGLTALRRSEEKKDSTENVKGLKFKANDNSPHLFILLTDPEKVNENRLLYEIASYNFTKFLVKDFDIKVQKGELTVSGLDNLEEALWYINGVFDDRGIQRLLSGTEYKYLIITEENYELLLKGLTVEEYETFFKNYMANQKKKGTGGKVQLVGEEKELEEITNEQNTVSEIKEGDDLNGAKPTVKLQSGDSVKAEKMQTPVEVTPQQQPAQEIKPETVLEKSETVNTVPKAPKELKKYKGLYTYDEDAPHYFVIILPKGGADFEAVKAALDKYNSASQALLNLNVMQESGKGFSQMIVTGTIPGAAIARSYIQQVVKDEGIKNTLRGTDYRNIVISQDNLKTLKESGNFAVYMELFKHFYLK